MSLQVGSFLLLLFHWGIAVVLALLLLSEGNKCHVSIFFYMHGWTCNIISAITFPLSSGLMLTELNGTSTDHGLNCCSADWSLLPHSALSSLTCTQSFAVEDELSTIWVTVSIRWLPSSTWRCTHVVIAGWKTQCVKYGMANNIVCWSSYLLV